MEEMAPSEQVEMMGNVGGDDDDMRLDDILIYCIMYLCCFFFFLFDKNCMYHF